jgi:hypothetical protein
MFGFGALSTDARTCKVQVNFCIDLCCRDDERRWQDEMMRQMDDWMEKNSSLLRSEDWGAAGPLPCTDDSEGFHRKMEHVWELLNHAGRCIFQLQESSCFDQSRIFLFGHLAYFPIHLHLPSLIMCQLCLCCVCLGLCAGLADYLRCGRATRSGSCRSEFRRRCWRRPSRAGRRLRRERSGSVPRWKRA